MCGILAVFSNNTPIDKNIILRDGSYLSKRGPDSRNEIITENNGIYIFHRLSINDVSGNGNQPMIDGNTLMMCNGEIYNYKDLIQQYDLKCHSKSDCEVILHLYKKFGFFEMVKKLYGVFAIVLVDGDNVYFARDRIGVRPLYTGWTREGFLAVSSVPNCLVNFCKNVDPVLPGTSLQYNKRLKQLGAVLYDKVLLPKNRISTEEGLDRLRNTLIKAVKIRLITDRPIGCLLSGGLDSSLICAILVSLIGKDNVRTYSIGMEGSTDLHYAKKVANYLGTKHTEVLFTPEEGFNIIPEVIQILASYDITTIRASVGMYLISKYIAKNTSDKVIFSGEGSDELLQGYLYFHKAPCPIAGEWESLRLIKNLHRYDVLRSDRCISSCGLEPRVPFLDKDFVNTTLSLQQEDKIPQQGFEKYILRKAFVGFLPEEVLWRRKEGFSDGVSSMNKPWYHYIKEKVEPLIPDVIFNHKFPSKEAMYYKLIFDKIFPTYNLYLPYWMPKWTDESDPSGRLITI